MRASFRLFLTHRLLWSFIGVTALSCLLWMLGPLITWNETRPLEPALHREIALSLLYLLWVVLQLIPAVYRAWYNSRLLDRLQVAESADPAERQATEALLSQRFSEAAMRLKRTHFGRRQGSL